MRYLNLTGVLWGVFFIGGQWVWAAELPGAFEAGSTRRPTSNTYMQDSDNPKVKLGEVTGTIKSMDRVSGKISVQDAKGMAMEFSVETNTSVQDRHFQISLDDLRVGDRVNVHYDIDPRLVNRIERL